MKLQFLLRKLSLSVVTLTLLGSAFAQKPGSTPPRQEKLLNGLKVLMWNNPTADMVTIKIRVHSGSAFDPQDKEGVTKLLADTIFPNAAAKDFFTDDLGGSLDITSNYDFIQITATAKTAEFLTMLETLAAAVSNPVIDKETTAAVKIVHLGKLAELEKDPSYVADRAVAKRLFGTFPYGRPQMGTPASIQKIDFVDLKFAKDRFFSADNATVAISGNFNSDLGFRAVRRYFGSWLKSDKKIPSTFKQPDEPDTAPVEVAMPDAAGSQVRYALRGLARNDKDYAASEILSRILDSRFKTAVNSGPDTSVINNAHILPGTIVYRNASSGRSDQKLATGIAAAISMDEFSKAKAEILAANAKRPIDEFWLDADTYKFVLTDEHMAFQNAALADVQRVAVRLAKNPVVSVTVQAAAPVAVNDKD
ncbi:MAG: pitrilysin family protein [Pyrinomonadaceae bacterium]